jgi:hypothetical protein
VTEGTGLTGLDARGAVQALDGRFQGGCEAGEHVEGEVLLAALAVADVVAVAVGKFSELLLGKAEGPAAVADGNARPAAVVRRVAPTDGASGAKGGAVGYPLE